MNFINTPGNPPPPGAEALWIEGYKGFKLRACITPATGQTRGTVIIFPGYTEYLEKYFETATDLQNRGFVSFVMDWRGQGLSQRPLKNRHIYHLNDFDEPGHDMAHALALLEPRLPRPWVVLAHSMGGAIALRALLKSRFQAQAALFSAPMWGIAAAKPLNMALARTMRVIGFGGTPTTFAARLPKEEAFETNTVTSDPNRFGRNWEIWRAAPDVQVAGPSFGWFAAACDAVNSFRDPKQLKRLDFPITILSAGGEKIVVNAAHREVASHLPNAVYGTIIDAKHELLQESDEYRAQLFEAFDALIRRASI